MNPESGMNSDPAVFQAFNNPNQSLWNFRIAEYMQERCGMAGAVILMMVK